MALLSSKSVRHYALSFVCMLVGAWLTDVTDSLLPLSLGGAALLMITLPLVLAIRARYATQRDTRRRRRP